MFSLFLRPISPHDVRLYALCDEIEHSKRFYLSPIPSGLKKRRPKIASAVHLYGDVTFFDASASFLSPTALKRLKKRRPKKRKQAEIICL